MLQILEAQLAAGTASQMLFARINAPRFAKLYSTRGRWGLLDHVLLAPETTSTAATLEATAAAATAPSSGSHSAGIGLQQVEQAVKQAAADILGEQLGDSDSFSAGGFDSLSAVALSSSLSSTLGKELPGTLMYDYPSVSAMAQHIHSLLAPAEPAGGSGASGALLPAVPTALVASGASLTAGSIALAARLPTGYSARGGETIVGGADSISLVPFGRWDLEALRVSLGVCCWRLWGVLGSRGTINLPAAG